jgi:lantibiotic modifying enzyme
MNHHSFLEQADRIGAQLCRDAIWDGGRCNWVAAGFGEDGEEYRAVNPALYGGTSGIALFLGRLSRATGERIFSDTARAALQQTLSQVGESPTKRFAPGMETGLYSGLSGVAMVLSEFEEPFHSRGIELAETAVTLPPIPENDLLGGLAGVVAAALHFYRTTGKDVFLEAAIRHGEGLLGAARRSEAGWSWPTLVSIDVPDRPDLTGFGHGTGGVAWALLELWHRTGEQKFRAAAEEGFRYEQSCFSAEAGNWKDFRTWSAEDPQVMYTAMWCNGAGGIAFSRMRAAQLIPEDPQYARQAEIALRIVERELPNQSICCICHGRFGSIDLLLHANTPERIALAQHAAHEAIDLYPARRLPWRCMSELDGETPGLMLGLAGIGHTFLRLADPAAFPSPLIL